MSDDMRSPQEKQADSENGLSQNCPEAWVCGKKWGRSATPTPANTRARRTLIICLIPPEADKPFDLSLRIRMDCETYFTSIILLVSVKSPAVNL